jgi:hypothetical protein
MVDPCDMFKTVGAVAGGAVIAAVDMVRRFGGRDDETALVVAGNALFRRALAPVSGKPVLKWSKSTFLAADTSSTRAPRMRAAVRQIGSDQAMRLIISPLSS